MGDPRGEVMPRGRSGIGEVPDPGLPVDEEIEDRMSQVRHVCGRYDGSRRSPHRVTRSHVAQRVINEVAAIPRAEERACADNQRVRIGARYTPFGFRFALSIEARGRKRVLLDIGRPS